MIGDTRNHVCSDTRSDRIPVFVSLCSLLSTCFEIKRLAMMAQAERHAERMKMFLIAHAKASLTANFWLASAIVEISSTLPAALLPESFVTRSLERPDALMSAVCCCMPFWKTTPPMITDNAVARFRDNPRVAVAVAVSS